MYDYVCLVIISGYVIGLDDFSIWDYYSLNDDYGLLVGMGIDEYFSLSRCLCCVLCLKGYFEFE